MSSFGVTRSVFIPTSSTEHAISRLDGVSPVTHDARQIEYMVVAFNDDERTAVLSLRQTEILAKLTTAVSNICTEKAVQPYVTSFSNTCY